MSGVIYTFYSYKGGVGRSMAVANIGVHFSRQGYRTLLIDMDLEAPGLEQYFENDPHFDTSEVPQCRGFCDFIADYLKRASEEPDDPDQLPYPPVDDYISKIGSDSENTLMLMHAGRRAGAEWDDYARFVQSFDWTDFYERWEGGCCLEWLAAELRERADIVLIDSRTGVTEMGGVATQHLADVVIVMFGSNLQNVDSSARMAESFLSAPVREERERPLAIMAVPSRIDDQDSRGFLEFQSRYMEALKAISNPAPVDGYSMSDMCIPYLAPFSYREMIVSGNPETEVSARRLVEAYTRIAANMQRLAPPGSALREGTPPAGKESGDVALLAASGDEQLAESVKSRLEAKGVGCQILDPRLQDGKDLPNVLRHTRLVVAIVTPAFCESLLIRSLLKLVTDHSKQILPAVFRTVQLMPLLLADKIPVDCTGDVEAAVQRLAMALEALRRPKPERGVGRGRVYLSYSQSDAPCASRVEHCLRTKGFSVWWDREIQPGANWLAEVEQALSSADVMVALLSQLPRGRRLYSRNGRSSSKRKSRSFRYRLNGPLYRSFLRHAAASTL